MAADSQPAVPQPGSRRDQEGRAKWTDRAALLALALLGGTWTWWALKYGAYFGTVLYPGAALLALSTAVLLMTAPRRARLAHSGPARLALWSLVGLAGWSLASVLWSPTPDIAVADAQRILAYALAFGLGIWACTLLATRMELSMLPLAIAAAIAGAVTLIGLSGSDDPNRYLELDGTLDYPLGYRNATAAFFLIALWPALGLASSARIPGFLRLGALATATLCFEVGILCQSRGAILGGAVGLTVYLLAAPRRGRALAWLVLAAAPALISLPAANGLYDAAKVSGELSGVVDQMNSAGRIALIGVGIAAMAGLVALRLEPNIRLRRPGWATPSRTRGLWVTALAALAVLVLVVIGNPVSWAGDRFDEFSSGEPDLSQQSNRFTLNAGSNRSDVWRVALDAAGDDPLFGEGGGGFQFRYNRDRDEVTQIARDAHSVWLEMLSELGVVGVGLFTAAMVGAFAGAMRARRLGQASAQLSCAALAAGAYWLTHASVDWFWPYPAVTAPVLALLGSAAAPALLQREKPPGSARLALLVGVVAFALSVIPPFLSEGLTERALSIFRADTEQAYDDLGLARDLNPLTDLPMLTEGAIAQELDDRERAIAAFREAARKRPEEYAAHYFLAILYAKEDPALARTELAIVTELNPLTPRVDEIRERIEATERRREPEEGR